MADGFLEGIGRAFRIFGAEGEAYAKPQGAEPVPTKKLADEPLCSKYDANCVEPPKFGGCNANPSLSNSYGRSVDKAFADAYDQYRYLLLGAKRLF